MALEHIYQWNRLDSPKLNQYRYGQLIYDEGDKNTRGEKTVSPINGAGKTGWLHVKE